MNTVSPSVSQAGSLSIQVDLRKDADTIVYHFSDRNTKAGKFNRFPTPKDVSNVYLNPVCANWYLDGLPWLESLRATVATLKALAHDSGASKIVCIGSLMGAWGAAYMAPMLGAQTAILFSPKLRLNCVGSVSSQNLGHLTSGIPTINATNGCKYFVVAGMMSPCHLYGAAAFFGAGDLSTCYFVPWMGSATVQGLSRIGVLDQVIEAFLNGCESPAILGALKF